MVIDWIQVTSKLAIITSLLTLFAAHNKRITDIAYRVKYTRY
jgi:hypothetical protein